MLAAPPAPGQKPASLIHGAVPDQPPRDSSAGGHCHSELCTTKFPFLVLSMGSANRLPSCFSGYEHLADDSGFQPTSFLHHSLRCTQLPNKTHLTAKETSAATLGLCSLGEGGHTVAGHKRTLISKTATGQTWRNTSGTVVLLTALVIFSPLC